MNEEMVDAHIMKRVLTEIVIVPGHEERKASREFLRSVARLKKDGHYKCWVDGSTEDLQVHHFGAEWCLADDVDFDKLKEFCEIFDPYGYGQLLKNTPITSVDDVRNCLVLSQKYHTGGMTDGVANGIHNITFPAWISQKLSKVGESPIPDDTKDMSADLTRELAEEKF